MTCPIGTDVLLAAELIRSGGLVALPTETVYGLGADATNVRAMARVFEVKERPRFDPIIVHLAAWDWLERYVAEIPPLARRLAEHFWPGPLTLVLKKRGVVPDLVTAGLDSVAVRVPQHPLALELLRAADRAIGAPSANPFGRISPTTAAHVAEQLGDKIDYILDGGPCRVGLESTVLSVLGDELVLLRPGGLPVEEIEAVAGPVRIPPRADSPATETDPASASLAPGMLPRHYAPRTRLVIEDEPSSIHAGQSVGYIGLEAPAQPTQFAALEVLSARGDLTEAGVGFFAALRRLDALGLDLIVARTFPERGLGRALNDRLRRAAK